MELSARAHIPFSGNPRIVRIESVDGPWTSPLINRAVIAERTFNREDEVPTVFVRNGQSGSNSIRLPESLGYLDVGDVVRVNPHAGEIRVLYRKSSRSNSVLLTERCNSRCVMCSQPPRDVDDGYLVDDLLESIPLMSRETRELGISGGEPTLLGERLIEVIALAKSRLPTTALHILSNARGLQSLAYARRIASVQHPDMMFGIPVYADNAVDHDYVVQARGAFNETVLGLLNLARVGVRTEIRVVLHRETFRRLPQLARFITRNLPFAHHVALMGLELMGFAKTNAKALWMDPRDYGSQLTEAVDMLDALGIRPVIYNLPLCVLPPTLWRYSVQSISDWKNVFASECTKCSYREQCGGMFASSAVLLAPLLCAVH